MNMTPTNPATGTISITQREVATARVSASGAQNIWVTNEYGTVLAWYVGGGTRDMDLDEEWGQAMQLTGHASYADGTCASASRAYGLALWRGVKMFGRVTCVHTGQYVGLWLL